MQIDATTHERFVREFGINMLNTITTRSHRATAHRRRIHVFDERGGIFGGHTDTVLAYQNLTTGVFISNRRGTIGVRYRCRPNDLEVEEIGAFHTHPTHHDSNLKRVRVRMERMLWLSDMDIRAFRAQHRHYGYQWHFVGSVDIGCFHIHDVQKGQRGPRHIIRYPDLEGLVTRLEPLIQHYDQLLHRQANRRGNPGSDLLLGLLRLHTGRSGSATTIAAGLAGQELADVSRRLAQELQLLGYSARQITGLVQRVDGREAPLAVAVDRELATLAQLRPDHA